MSNPNLDKGAEIIASMRAHAHLAALEPVEQALIERALGLAPELDRTAVGAAWMLLGDGLAQVAGPGQLTVEQAVNVAQLAGQRLYTGTGLPREVACPQVYGSGRPCRFAAKGVGDSAIDAQMRGHYATYHPGETWPPEPETVEPSQCIACLKPKQPFVPYGEGFICAECALIRGAASVNDVRRHLGFPPLEGDCAAFDKPLDRRYFMRCSMCTKAVVVHGTIGQNAGYVTVEGILCAACNRDYRRRSAAIQAAAEEATVREPVVHLPHTLYMSAVSVALHALGDPYDDHTWEATTPDGEILEGVFRFRDGAPSPDEWPDGVVLQWSQTAGWQLCTLGENRTLHDLGVSAYANPELVAFYADRMLMWGPGATRDPLMFEEPWGGQVALEQAVARFEAESRKAAAWIAESLGRADAEVYAADHPLPGDEDGA